MRTATASDWEKALAGLREIEARLQEWTAVRSVSIEFSMSAKARGKLQQLQEALASNNLTLGNLELSRRIDRITCYSDGRVIVRICKLGAFRDALNLVADPASVSPDPPVPTPASKAVNSKPRRRARLRTDPLASNAGEFKDAAHFAADPKRFAGVGDQWFWTDFLQIPAKTCWASAHAAKVARERAAGATMEQLAAHFQKTVPTIREALRRAALADPAVGELPRKMPQRRWTIDHAAEVADLKRQGMNVDAIAVKLGKSRYHHPRSLAARSGTVPDNANAAQSRTAADALSTRRTVWSKSGPRPLASVETSLLLGTQGRLRFHQRVPAKKLRPAAGTVRDGHACQQRAPAGVSLALS